MDCQPVGCRKSGRPAAAGRTLQLVTEWRTPRRALPDKRQILRCRRRGQRQQAPCTVNFRPASKDRCARVMSSPDAADVLAYASASACKKPHAVVRLFQFLPHLHQHRRSRPDTAPVMMRRRCPGHSPLETVDRQRLYRHRQGVACLEVRFQACRVTVHRGIHRTPGTLSGDDIARRSAKTAHEGQRFDVLRRGKSVTSA